MAGEAQSYRIIWFKAQSFTSPTNEMTAIMGDRVTGVIESDSRPAALTKLVPLSNVLGEDAVSLIVLQFLSSMRTA
jgi:hypothetical protein